MVSRLKLKANSGHLTDKASSRTRSQSSGVDKPLVHKDYRILHKQTGCEHNSITRYSENLYVDVD